MYIRIDEDSFYQIKYTLESLETFGLVLIENRTNKGNQGIATLIITLAKAGISAIENGSLDPNE